MKPSNTNTNTNTIAAALETIKGAQSDLQAQIAQAVTFEQDLSKQIQALRAMPISLTDFSQYLKAHIEFNGAAWFAGRAPAHMLIARTGNTPMNKKGWGDYEPVTGVVASHEFFMPEFCTLNQGDAFGALCFAMPDTMHEKLMTAYRAAIGDRWGNEDMPTVQERRAATSELHERIAVSAKQRGDMQASLGELTGVIDGTGQGGGNGRSGVDSDATAGGFGGSAKPVAFKGQRLSNPDLVE